MKANDFIREIEKKKKELDILLRRRLPVKAGRMAKDHFQDNFRQGGFVDNGLHPWPATQRQRSGSSAASANYSPLLSRRNHLFNSIKYIPADYRVRILNEVPYAAIHNEGGETHPKVTPAMRAHAWKMFYKSIGKKTSPKGQKKNRHRDGGITPEALKWKHLALTKKSKLDIKIPRRQFIGESKELNERVRKTIETEIKNILNF